MSVIGLARSKYTYIGLCNNILVLTLAGRYDKFDLESNN